MPELPSDLDIPWCAADEIRVQAVRRRIFDRMGAMTECAADHASSDGFEMDSVVEAYKRDIDRNFSART